MSIIGNSDSNKNYRKQSHRRNDSGELDVFEAARYFSASTEVSGGHNGFTYTQKSVREERQQGWRSGGRISLDFPMRNSIASQTQVMEKQVKEKKKYKQPSSPGGRLASFLNSLFHQIPNKKKKSKSTTTTQSVKDEDESPGGGRRKRRSSISHFRSGSNNTEYSKSIYSSSMSSGFRTPPTKFYKDLRSYSDHKHVVPSLPKYDDKFKLTNGCGDKFKNLAGAGVSEKERKWADRYPSEERELGKFSDGGESDSSSDLFELENCDLGYYPSGLPVYETTHMDNIKRGAPISNGA